MDIQANETHAGQGNGEAPEKKALSEDESLLWEGKPERRFFLSLVDIFVISGACLFLVFSALFVIWSVPEVFTSAPVLAQVFSVAFWGVFFAFGIGPVICRLIVKPINRGRTSYSITTKRIIISTGDKSRDFLPIDINSVSYKKGWLLGLGYITISVRRNFVDMSVGALLREFWCGPHSLEAIPDAHKAFSAAQRLMDRSTY